MNQVALISDRVQLQQDPLQFQRVSYQSQTIPVEGRGKTCSSSLRGGLIVHSPTNVTVEELRCEGDFVRAVVLLILDPVYRVIESMWQNATSGTQFKRVDPGYARQDSTFVLEHKSAERAQAARRVERLTEIQGNLGLSMRVLAETLRITRPTLYKWFDTEKLISLQNDSVRRLDQVERLARSWRALSVAPLGPWVRERIEGGQSLHDLLTTEPMPTAEIERVFSQISIRNVQAPKSRSAQLREAGFTRRASHRSLPSDE